MGFLVLTAVTVFATPWRYEQGPSELARIANGPRSVVEGNELRVVHRPIFSKPDKASLELSGEADHWTPIADVEIDVGRLALYWAGIVLVTVAFILLVPESADRVEAPEVSPRKRRTGRPFRGFR